MALSFRPSASSTDPQNALTFSQPSSSRNGYSFRNSQPPLKPAPTLDLPALQDASRVLQDQFAKDARLVPDLGESLTVPGATSSFSYSVSPDDSRVQFQKRRFIDIPAELWTHYTNSHHNTRMDIMPELERVWISIDHKLLLWDYVDGQAMSTFEDQPDVIQHVALVKAKPGIFIDEINYLLVICTAVSVVLLGVSSTDVPGTNNRTRKDIRLYATDWSISVNVDMVSVVGTEDGRIFMAGQQDGNLYELHYQEKEGWFGKRIQLINHSVAGVQSIFPRFSGPNHENHIIAVVSDPSRNLIYTRTASNIICVYQPQGEKTVQLVQTLHNLYRAALEKASGSPAINSKAFKFVGLYPVDQNESRSGVSLMAITENGVRLYFSQAASQLGYYPNAGADGARGHRQLTLIHVRLPPPNLLHPDEQSNRYRSTAPGYGAQRNPSEPASRPYIITHLENVLYSSGLTIAAQDGDAGDGKDFLLCVAPELPKMGNFGQVTPQYVNTPYGGGAGPQRPPLVERAALLTIPGRTWALAAVPRPKTAYAATIGAPNTPTPPVTNEVAYQFSEPPRQFMVMTNEGMSILAKRRPLDWLRDAVEELHADGNMQALIEFRDSFGRDQMCAMLLALACGNTFLDLGDPSPLGSVATLPPDLANVAKQAFYDFGEKPMWTERMTYGASDGSGTALFSGRREGLAIYFSRLVRPVWKTKLTQPGPLGLYVSNIDEELLWMVQKNMYALKDFLEKNPHLFHSATGDYAGARSAPAGDQEAWKAEQHSVAQLQTLLSRTIEGAAFFLLLNDHRIGELIAQTDPETQKVITNLTFEGLITGNEGVLVSRSLVNVIIDQQIGQQIGVDTISDVLQTRCGSFCSTDDVMLYKAKENIRRAVESGNPTERQNHLSESLRLFMKGARILDFDKLREVIGDYQELDYAKGTIELPLHCADTSDPDRLGQEYWQSSPELCVGYGLVMQPEIAAAIALESVSDTVKREAWQRRSQCYDLALDSLEVYERKATAGNESAERVRTHAYELAFASLDEMFHARLYEWLIQRGLADELLEMRPAYLEAFLQRDPVTVKKYQLLWQFYVKDGQPLRAAEVLSVLAESTQFPLRLVNRLEYLTLAVGNAKSHPIAVNGKHESAIAFLTELEEKLEVAQVQLETYNALLHPRTTAAGLEKDTAEHLELLDRTLMDVSELYQVYAEPYDLHEIKLLILHVSQHRDEKMVVDIWNRIFDACIKRHELDPAQVAEEIRGQVETLGQRFYPSDCAFPFRHVTILLVGYQLEHTDVIQPDWVPRTLLRAGVPFAEIWDVLHQLHDSHIPPYHSPQACELLEDAISILLQDWLDAAKRSAGEFFPVDRIDSAVHTYLTELPKTAPSRIRERFESIRRDLRRSW